MIQLSLKCDAFVCVYQSVHWCDSYSKTYTSTITGALLLTGVVGVAGVTGSESLLL